MHRLRPALALVTLSVLLWGFLAAGPLSAQPGRPAPKLLGESPPAPDAPEVANALFWPLPQGLFFLSGTVPVETQVRINGELSFSESFEMEMPGSVEGRAVELLVTRPHELSLLRELAARPGTQITVRVLIDGVEWDAKPFAELDAASRRLQQGKLQLANLRFGDSSELKTPLVQRAVSAEACQDNCQQQYLNCIEIECYPQIFCETCEVEYQYCLDGCPPPPDPCAGNPTAVKSITYRTVTSLVGYGPTGYWQCFEDIWENDFYDGTYYEEWQYTYKDTRIKRTEYCNGSVTEEVVSVTYWYFFCNRPTYLFCYYPWTWAYNVCY